MSNLIKNLLTLCMFLLVASSIVAQSADLRLEYETSPTPAIISVGDTLKVRYEVSNTGSANATGSQMTIDLSTGFQIVESMSTAGSFSNNVWDIGTVPSEESEILLVFITKTSEGLGTLEAEITQMTGGGPDPDSTPNNEDAAEDDFQSFCISTVKEFYQPQVITLSAGADMTDVQWYKDDVLIVGADSIDFDATEEGIYYFNAAGSPCELGGCCPIQLKEVPPPPCSVTALLAEISCNDNGSSTIATDDYIDFKITTTGESLSGGFTLSADNGTISKQDGSAATNLQYGVDSLFRMQNGAAGAGDIQVIITDTMDITCKDTLTIIDPGVCSTPVCSMVLSLAPDDCDTDDNNYELVGSVTFSTPPTTGTLSILVDGIVQQTFTAPFTTPQAISITDLISDGLAHSVTSTFSDAASCQVQMNFNAPEPCMISSTCSVNATVAVGTCDSEDNEYELSGNVTFSDAPDSGTLTVSAGPFQQVFTAPFTSPQAYTLSGLIADGSGHDLTVVFSADAFCRFDTTYIAPAGCDPVACGITMTATPGTCSSNKFDLTGEISFTNAPDTGMLSIDLGGESIIFSAPFTSPQTYSFTDLIADGSTRSLTASFSDDITCAANIDFTSPIACDNAVCAVSLDLVPSACSDNTYSLSGTVAMVNAPTTGNLIIAAGGTTYLTLAMPSTSPINFTLLGLPADGQALIFDATFSADATCTDTITILAPATCVGTCSMNAVVADVQCNDNSSSTANDDYITFELNPTGTNLSATYQVTSTTGSVYLLSGALADNVPYGQATTFRMANGSAGSGDLSINVQDNSTSTCVQGPLTIPDPDICSCEESTGTIAANQVTCDGSDSKQDASLVLTSVTDGDKFNYSIGETYTGDTDYANAIAIGTLPDTLVSNLANPTDSIKYTIRIFNNRSNCFKDSTVTLLEKTCTCTNPTLADLTDESICEEGTFTATNLTTSVTNDIPVSYQWFDNDGVNNTGTAAIAGQITATLTNLPTTVGTYSYKVVATSTQPGGCSAEKIVNLTILPISETPITENICAGESFTFNNQNLTTAGIYRDTMTAVNGCDSFLVLTLNVIDEMETTISQDICSGDSYTFDGQTLTTTGTYRDTMTAIGGCDSIIILTLGVIDPIEISLSEEICQGNTYTFNNQTLNTAGTYRDTMSAASGCDSIITLTLSTLDTVQTNIRQDICAGENFTFNNQDLSEAGIYRDTMTAANGCDSFVVLTLNILNISETPINQDICNGDSFTFDNQSLTVAGTYRDTMTAANGCDSIIILSLNVLDTIQIPISQEICEGDSYTFNNQNLTTAGIYRDTLTAVNGCDSFLVLTLNVIDEMETTISQDICSGDSYTFDGQVLTTAGTYRDTMTAIGGCDSIIILNLNVLEKIETPLLQEICHGDTFDFNNQSLTIAGIYQDTLTATGGCDSILILTLEILDKMESNSREVICLGDSFKFNNQSLTTAGIYQDTLTAAGGCDSIIVLTLEVIDIIETNINETICQDDSFTFNNQNLSTAGIYQDTLTAANGCDSIIILNLNINPNTVSTVVYEGCEEDNYSILVGSTTYNEANPTGTEILTNATGCDSIVSINLVFNPNLNSEVTYIGCEEDGYEVVVNGATYDEFNPIGTEVLTTSKGCDSTVTINLVFNPLNKAACGLFDLALEKSTDSTIVRLGDLVTYTIEVSNEGTIDAYDVNITDFIPTGMSLADANWTASQDTARFNTPISYLPAGASYELYITLKVDLDFTGTTLVNFAEISEADDDTDPSNTPPVDEDSTPDEDKENEDEDDDDSAIVTVVEEGEEIFDLALIETLAPGQSGMVQAGEEVAIKIKVSNQGTLPAETIEVTQYLPEGLILSSNNSQDWVAENDSTASILLTAGNQLPTDGLAPDSMIMVMIQVVVEDDVIGGKLTPHAEISDDGIQEDIDSTPDDNRTNDAGGIPNTDSDNSSDQLPPSDEDDADPVQIMIQEFDLALTEELLTEGPITPGDSITAKIKIFNQGDIVADAIEIYAYIPEGLLLDDDRWTAIDDSTAVLTLAVASNELPAEGLVPNEMTMITIGFQVDEMFMDTCIISYAEIGSATDENGTAVTDIDSTPDSDRTNDTGGQVFTPTDNTTEEIPPVDEDDHDPVKILVEQIFDLALDKSTEATTVKLGDLVTYQLTITNEGTLDAYAIGITDFIPDGMSLQDPNWTATGDTARYNTPISYLAAGEETAISITLQVDLDFLGTSLINVAEISAADDDTDPTNAPPMDEDSTPDEDMENEDEDDDDPAVVNVIQVFDLALIETLAPAQSSMVRPGESVDLKIKVFNQGTLPADTIEITQYLPVGMTLDASNPQGWTAINDSTAQIVLTSGQGLPIAGLEADSMLMIPIQVIVDPTTNASKLTPYAEISNDGVDKNDIDSSPDDIRDNDMGGQVNTDTDNSTDQIPPTDEDDQDPVQVMLLEFDLALTEELLTEGPIAPGDSITAKIKVVNQGDIPADAIEIYAYIPEGLLLDDERWTAIDDSTAVLILSTANGDLTIDGLQPTEMIMTTIGFSVSETVEDTCLITYAEIASSTDENGLPIMDVDSTPDSIRSNDSGGVVDTPTDNEVTETAPIDEDDHDPVKVLIEEIFDVALEKSTDAMLVNLGDLVTYQLTVSNQGNVAAYNIGVSDFIPNGMILQDNNWTASGDTVRFNTPIPLLAAGESQTIEITLQVDPLFTSTAIDNQFINYAEISSADDDTDPNNDPPTDEDSTPDEDMENEEEDDDDTAVVNLIPLADLALIETLAPGQSGMVRPGEVVELKISVFNQGTYPTSTIEITQYLPEGLLMNTNNLQDWTSLNDSTAQITLTPSNGLPAAGLLPDSMVTVCLEVLVESNVTETKLVAHAEISADGLAIDDVDSTPDDIRTNDVGGVPNTDTDDTTDSSPASDEDDEDPVQVMILEFDLALTEELLTEGPIFPGDSITGKIKVVNQGTISADSIKVVAYIPEGLIVNDDRWTVMDDSTAMLLLTIMDNDLPTTGLVAGEMIMPTIDFVVSPDFQDTCLITYAEIVSATDENGQAVTDIDSTPNDDRTDDTGGEVNSSTDNTVDQTPPTDEDDHDPMKIEVQQIFDLALEKSTDSTIVEAGDFVTYQLAIRNEGTVDAYNIEISDFIPTGMSLQDANWTAFGDTARWNTPIAFLASGTSQTIDITLQVDPDFMGTSLVNFAEITAADDDTDPNNTPPMDEDSTPDENMENEEEDDDDIAVIHVGQIFDLALIETLGDDQASMVQSGDTALLKIIVFNQGTLPADTIVITQYIPDSVRLAPGLGWTSIDERMANIMLTNSNGLPANGLAPDSMVMVFIEVIIESDDPSIFVTPVAEISYDGSTYKDYDSTPNEDPTDDTGGMVNTSTDNVVDLLKPLDEDDQDPVRLGLLSFDLALTEELLTEGPVHPGDSISGKIKVFNQGSIAADNITIYAYIPTGMTLADEDWRVVDDSTAVITLSTKDGELPSGGLLPDEMTMLTIDFVIDPDFMETCLITYAEIGDATDESGNSLRDVDSTPDNNIDNDTGGVPNSATDNAIDQTPPTDEDDHDPMKIRVEQVFDLALIIELAPTQELEVKQADTVCFEITVVNQGTVDAYDIGIVNYVPEGLVFDAALNQQLGSNWQVDSTYQLAALSAGDTAIIPIKFIVDMDIMDSLVIDTAEIYFATTTTGNPINTIDEDSEADNNNDDFIGGDDLLNSELNDEDDHDFVYVVNLQEVDPTGYIYADKTGKIIKGGKISVTPPPGGVAMIIMDGSDGMYKWFTNGVPGTYTMTYEHPDGYVLSKNCSANAGVYDPTGRDGAAEDMDRDGTNDIIQLGSDVVNSDSTYLINFDCGDNPYFLDFFLQSGDPFITENNLPIQESFIGAIVCEDSDGDLIPSENDLPMMDVSVYLYTCGDTINPIDSTKTDINGAYEFGALTSGDYIVQFISPTTHRLALEAIPLSQTALRNGFTECITLTAGACDTTNSVCLVACKEIDLSISPDSIVEVGQAVTVSVNTPGTFDFTWTPAASVHCNTPTCETVNILSDQSDTYTVIMDDRYGCIDQESFNIEVINSDTFDLALVKRLAPTQQSPVFPGSPVAYQMTIFNQGNVDAFDIAIIDYIPDGLDFSLAANTAVSTNNTNDWNLVDGVPNYIINTLASSESVTINITFTIDVDFKGTTITNFGEIAHASDTPSGPNTPDIDSSADDDMENDNHTADDAVDGYGNQGGDEDDHDPAFIQLFAPEDIVIFGDTTIPVADSVLTDTITDIDPEATPLFEEEIVEEVDCSQLPAYCYHGLAIELMPIGMVETWASDISVNDFSKCPDYQLGLWHESMPMKQPTTLAEVRALPTNLVFTCATLGNQEVQLYITDPEGNWNFCETYINVQDNNIACVESQNTDAQNALLGGQVSTWKGDAVQEVLLSTTQDNYMTKQDGFYHFELTMEESYTITPQKNHVPLNGVSTFDLVLMTKHILGVQPFDNPYQWIAADVNQSKTVTAFDLVQLRKMILAIDTEFTNNTSWRFVEANYDFTTDNPLSEDFPEQAHVSNLSSNMVMNFVAVKIGDINGNVRPNAFHQATPRNSEEVFEIQVADQFLKAGQTYEIDLQAKDISKVQGYQFTLNTRDVMIEQIQEAVMTTENFGLNNLDAGRITVSWNQQPDYLVSEEKLFTIQLKATKNARLSNVLQLNNHPTVAEAYDLEDNIMEVQLRFTNPDNTSEFELKQNQPNPFRNQTSIGYTLPANSSVELILRDEAGRVIQVIKQDGKAGYNVIQLNELETAPGFIYYQLITEFGTKSKKMIRVE